MNACVYYNEHDLAAAAWLRQLIADGCIPPGDVDERSIEDVRPDDVRGYRQCHWFAGIGGWPLALALAGWPSDRPVWTGSCPCQPFSAAGARGGFADQRHLWPAWFHIIRECRPASIFGEQVASSDGLRWLDLVCADVEAAGYAIGASDLCAAGGGAPHIRQRLYFGARRLADAVGYGPQGRLRGWPDSQWKALDGSAGCVRTDCGMEHATRDGRIEWRPEPIGRCVAGGCGEGWVADSDRDGCEPGSIAAEAAGHGDPARPASRDDRSGPACAHHVGWDAADWLYCRDGKWRPVEPGTFPLVDGLPRGVVPSSRIGMAIDANRTAEARVMRLRGYGNAIVPQVAAMFVRAFEGAA